MKKKKSEVVLEESADRLCELEGERLMKENVQLKLQVERLKVDIDELRRFYSSNS